MKNVKSGLRLLVMVLFIIMAAFGLGLTNALNSNRERYMDNEIKTEKVDKKENEENEEESKK